MEDQGKRLNKYISDAGVCSRREADRLIEAGRVYIRRKSRKDEPLRDREKAGVGDRVFHGDTVYVDDRELPKKEPDKQYFIYHKPRGVVCTADRSVPGNLVDALQLDKKLSYAGRLDKDSSGLLILTNDGELIDRMMRASSKHEKEYVCTTQNVLNEDFLNSMRSGVKIKLDDDETLRRHPDGLYVTTRPCYVKPINEKSFSIVLTQGLNRQIKRMGKALGNPITSIKRTRVLTLRLGNLKEGAMRRLTGEELQALKRKAGL